MDDFSTFRDVLWEVHVGHTWRRDPARHRRLEPLWKSLEAVEQDLQDMQAVHHYLRGRETRNRLRTHLYASYLPQLLHFRVAR